MIDVHCHLDMFKNPYRIIKEYENDQIIAISNTNLPLHFKEAFFHSRGLKVVRFALGFHPLLVSENINQINVFKSMINKTSYIGEVGLDFSREGISSRHVQLKMFENILDCIHAENKIVIVHSRKAEKDVIDLLQKYNINNVIFHWYTGDLNQLQRIIESNYYLSINPSMCLTSKGKNIINCIPIDLILTETDSPFSRFRDKQITKNDIKIIIAYFSKLYDIPLSEMESKIDKNLKTLFSKIR